jgi:hypothetical protein
MLESAAEYMYDELQEAYKRIHLLEDQLIMKNDNLAKTWRAMLQVGLLEVKFTKKNGDQREMKATLVPAFYELPKKTDESKAKKTRKDSDDAITVWDVEANGWRQIPLTAKPVSFKPFVRTVLEAEPGSVQYTEDLFIDE